MPTTANQLKEFTFIGQFTEPELANSETSICGVIRSISDTGNGIGSGLTIMQ